MKALVSMAGLVNWLSAEAKLIDDGPIVHLVFGTQGAAPQEISPVLAEVLLVLWPSCRLSFPNTGQIALLPARTTVIATMARSAKAAVPNTVTAASRTFPFALFMTSI